MINYNGNKIKDIMYNGSPISKVMQNGNVLYSRRPNNGVYIQSISGKLYTKDGVSIRTTKDVDP